MVSTVGVNDLREEEGLLRELLGTEKTNLTTLAQVLCGNYAEMGCQVGKAEEWIVEL